MTRVVDDVIRTEIGRQLAELDRLISTLCPPAILYHYVFSLGLGIPGERERDSGMIPNSDPG
jgi:hypothetical protein